jgi:cytosine deaminase
MNTDREELRTPGARAWPIDFVIPIARLRLRTFVEIDPRPGFRSFDTVKKLKADYAWAIDIENCAPAQEGVTNEPVTEAMLERALESGADLVGGCPYVDPQLVEHIRPIFDLGVRYDMLVDFHLDFDLDPKRSHLPAVIAEASARRRQGRVSVGHVTKLSAMGSEELEALGRALSEAGIAVAALPATDLYLKGRGVDRLLPRGVAPIHRLATQGVVTTIATNNVLNPLTPYGDVSLIRMANLFANVAQIGTSAELNMVFGMITRELSKPADRDTNGPAGSTVGLLDPAGGVAPIDLLKN